VSKIKRDIDEVFACFVSSLNESSVDEIEKMRVLASYRTALAIEELSCVLSKGFWGDSVPGPVEKIAMELGRIADSQV